MYARIFLETVENDKEIKFEKGTITRVEEVYTWLYDPFNIQ